MRYSLKKLQKLLDWISCNGNGLLCESKKLGIMKIFKYDNCFSLGWFCGTASAMGKLGLRSCSGPFDWYLSDYWAVIEQIKCKFSDFLNPANLAVDSNNPRIFRDTKYGFTYLHEVDSDFDNEYDLILEKYQKRIIRFLSLIRKPTLFFRCVRNEEEINFINENWKMIDAVIREFNVNNRIVYITLNSMGLLNESVINFKLPINAYIPKPLEMKYLFYESADLVEYCSAALDSSVIIKNKQFDTVSFERKEKIAVFVKMLEKRRDLADFFLQGQDADRGIYIFGAGVYGRTIVSLLKRYNYPILAVIDNNLNVPVGGIPVIKPEQAENGNVVFVAIEAKAVSDKIIRQLRDLDYKGKIVSFDDVIYELELDFQKEMLGWH